MKAHLPESLKQQLQAFEREKRESALSYASILEQRILAVDRDMLDKLSANHDEAGQKEEEEEEEGGRKWGKKRYVVSVCVWETLKLKLPHETNRGSTSHMSCKHTVQALLPRSVKSIPLVHFKIKLAVCVKVGMLRTMLSSTLIFTLSPLKGLGCIAEPHL